MIMLLERACDYITFVLAGEICFCPLVFRLKGKNSIKQKQALYTILCCK